MFFFFFSNLKSTDYKKETENKISAHLPTNNLAQPLCHKAPEKTTAQLELNNTCNAHTKPTLLTEDMCIYQLTPPKQEERFCLRRALRARRGSDPTQEVSLETPWIDMNKHIAPKESILKHYDRRTCVVNSAQWPWRVNGHLSLIFSDAERYLGSGTPISNNHVLTAAHNLYDKDKKIL